MNDLATLCAKCRLSNLDDLYGGPMAHHPNSAALKVAVDGGCKLCCLLWAGLTKDMTTEQIATFAADTSDESMLEFAPNGIASDAPQLSYAYDDRRGVYTLLDLFWEGIHPRYPNAPSTHISSHAASPDLQERMSKWAGTCASRHPDCGGAEPNELPTRVIDVGKFDSELKLVTSNGAKGRYIALSYCWGLSPGLSTTADNVNDHLQLIPYGKLPRTLQDAVQLTRALNIQYLWIDALCIIQARYIGDSEAVKDWQREASRMAGVYSNAYLTVAAGEGTDKNSGFLHPRPQHLSCQIAQNRQEAETGMSQEHPMFARLVLPTAPTHLDKRAWTLPESLLSKRVVTYRHEQVMFMCRGGKIYEKGRDVVPKGLVDVVGPMFFSAWNDQKFEADQHALMLRRWYVNLQIYSNRQSTSDDDRLPALSGLAHQCQSYIGGAYHAGLWESDFINGLWRCTIYGGSRLPVSKLVHRTRPARYRAPSWSWAALNGEIYYGYIREMGWASLNSPRWPTKILEIRTTPVGPFFDPMGQVSDSILKLHGPLRKASLVLNPERKYRSAKAFRNRWIWHLLTYLEDDAASLEVLTYREEKIAAVAMFDCADGWPRVITCLQLLPDRGLMLQESSDKPGEFVRVGMFVLEDYRWFDGADNQEVTII